jgi:hypothetical protein
MLTDFVDRYARREAVAVPACRRVQVGVVSARDDRAAIPRLRRLPVCERDDHETIVGSYTIHQLAPELFDGFEGKEGKG